MKERTNEREWEMDMAPSGVEPRRVTKFWALFTIYYYYDCYISVCNWEPCHNLYCYYLKCWWPHGLKTPFQLALFLCCAVLGCAVRLPQYRRFWLAFLPTIFIVADFKVGCNVLYLNLDHTKYPISKQINVFIFFHRKKRAEKRAK